MKPRPPSNGFRWPELVILQGFHKRNKRWCDFYFNLSKRNDGKWRFNIGYWIHILLCAVLWAAGGLPDPKSDRENSHLVTATATVFIGSIQTFNAAPDSGSRQANRRLTRSGRKFSSIKRRSNFEKNQPRPPEILILLSTQNISPNACLPGPQRSFLCRAPRI